MGHVQCLRRRLQRLTEDRRRLERPRWRRGRGTSTETARALVIVLPASTPTSAVHTNRPSRPRLLAPLPRRPRLRLPAEQLRRQRLLRLLCSSCKQPKTTRRPSLHHPSNTPGTGNTCGPVSTRLDCRGCWEGHIADQSTDRPTVDGAQTIVLPAMSP